MTNSTISTQKELLLDDKFWEDIEKLIHDAAELINGIFTTLGDAGVISAHVVKVVTTIVGKLAAAAVDILKTLLGPQK